MNGDVGDEDVCKLSNQTYVNEKKLKIICIKISNTIFSRSCEKKRARASMSETSRH